MSARTVGLSVRRADSAAYTTDTESSRQFIHTARAPAIYRGAWIVLRALVSLCPLCVQNLG